LARRGGRRSSTRVVGGYDCFPRARVILGSIKASTGEGVGVFGMEFTGTVRASF
jgi:hypothetical protein